MLGSPAKEAARENRGNGRVTEWVLIRTNWLLGYRLFHISGCNGTEQDTSKDCVATGVGTVCCGEGSVDCGGEGVMETDTDRPKFSKKHLENVSRAWRSRRDRRKKKRLAHTKKDKW